MGWPFVKLRTPLGNRALGCVFNTHRTSLEDLDGFLHDVVRVGDETTSGENVAGFSKTLVGLRSVSALGSTQSYDRFFRMAG